MLKENIVVSNKLGLHARPAAALAAAAGKYASEIKVSVAGEDGTGGGADCKSVLALLMLSAVQGTVLQFTFDGSDASDAMREIFSLFENNFGEE